MQHWTIDTYALGLAGLFALNFAQWLHARYVAAPRLDAARTAERWWRERCRAAETARAPARQEARRPPPVDKVTLCAPEFHAPRDSWSD